METGQKAKQAIDKLNKRLKAKITPESESLEARLVSEMNADKIPKELQNQVLEAVLSLPPPVFGTIVNTMAAYSWASDQKYTRYREMLLSDPELWGVTNDFASMVCNAFNAIVLHPGDSESEVERTVLEKAQEIGKHIDIEECFYAFAFNLMRDGDVVAIVDESKEIWDLVFLPMEFVTALDIQSQRGVTGISISNPNYYVLDEQNLLSPIDDIKTQKNIYPKKRVIHIPWSNRGTVTNDNLGRICYNVWSQSPLHSLQKLFEWKQAITDTDILWRSRMVPRLHHQINLEAYDPSKFAGKIEDKLSAARKAAQAVIDEYTIKAEYKKGDQDWITGQNVTISVIEAKSTTYHSPNELFDYFITIYCAISGIPKAAFQGDSGGSFAADVIISNYASMRAEIIATKIAKRITEFIKNYMYSLNSKIYPKKHIDKLEVQVSLMFNKDFRELGRFIGLLAGAGILTQDELRSYLGYLPLTEDQKKELQYIGQGGPVIPGIDKEKLHQSSAGGLGGRGNERTVGDTMGAAKKGGASDHPDTPDSEGKGQTT